MMWLCSCAGPPGDGRAARGVLADPLCHTGEPCHISSSATRVPTARWAAGAIQRTKLARPPHDRELGAVHYDVPFAPEHVGWHGTFALAMVPVAVLLEDGQPGQRLRELERVCGVRGRRCRAAADEQPMNLVVASRAGIRLHEYALHMISVAIAVWLPGALDQTI